MHTAEYAAVASAGLAAVAAAASWSSVWQNRRERVAAQRPDLIIEVSEHLPSHKIFVQIHNNGGTARGVRFCVMEGNFAAYGAPHPTGILRSGESRRIEADLPPTQDRAARRWISGVDVAARHVYATTTKGQQKRYRLKWMRKSMTDARITQDFYGIDPQQLSLVGHKTIDRQL